MVFVRKGRAAGDSQWSRESVTRVPEPLTGVCSLLAEKTGGRPSELVTEKRH